jgi:hypothetical protein
MEQIYNFYKEENGDWFIDLPIGMNGFTKEDYQMVAGADVMLDIISNYTDKVTLMISTDYFEGSDILELLKIKQYGADYYVPSLGKRTIGMSIWLCDVTKYIFDYFPEEIYIKKI